MDIWLKRFRPVRLQSESRTNSELASSSFFVDSLVAFARMRSCAVSSSIDD